MQNRIEAIEPEQPLRKIVVWTEPCEYDASDPEKGTVVTKTQRVWVAGEVNNHEQH